MSLSIDRNLMAVQSSVTVYLYMQVICVYCLHYICLHMCRHMPGEFSSRAALEQQSHKQTAVLSRDSAIRLPLSFNGQLTLSPL